MAVTVLIDGNEQTVPIHQLREGDEILLRHHELIPADAYLVSGYANIDYSFVTGESIPTTHAEGTLLYAGGRPMGGPILVRLKKRVNNSHNLLVYTE